MPLKGEIIVYSDVNKIKIGDGVTKVNDLAFSKTSISDVDELQDELDKKLNKTDANDYCKKGTSTSSSTTGITASASAPSFTGTAHAHTASDKGHTHTYTKVTGASFTGTKDQVTSKVTTGITATASAPSFTGSSHGHGITEPNKGAGHRHTYYKTTSATFSGADGTSGGSKTGITASASAPSFSGGSHGHSITEPNSGAGHTHGYDKVTSIWPNNSDKTTGSSKSGISVSVGAPGINTSAHNHGITEPNSGTGHTHGYDKVTNI